MNGEKTTPPVAISTPTVPKRRRKTQTDDGSHARAIIELLPGRIPSPTMSIGGGGGGGGGVSGGGVGGGGGGGGGASSSFRNVSACNRCRLRKNRCDQRLPACLSCEKAGVRCVGYDPITKREIPRSYVHYLETRVAYLESLLLSNNVAFSPADDFPDLPPMPPATPTVSTTTISTPLHLPALLSPTGIQPPIDPALHSHIESGRLSPPRIKRESPEALEGKKLDSLVSDIGLVSFAGASDPRYLGSVSGISFARVVFAAVKSTNPPAAEQNGAESTKGCHRRVASAGNRVRGSKGLGMGGGASKEDNPEDEADADTQMRDSFFGLHTKPTISPAPFPSRPVAERLVNLYFEHANPQIPSLHRGEFAGVLDTIYSSAEDKSNNASNDTAKNDARFGGTARELYLLNIVCAIGAGIFLSTPEETSGGETEEEDEDGESQEGPRKKQKFDSKNRKEKPKQSEPEAYHASAMLHLEAFLSQSKGGLDELQAVLLLAGYALLRPVSPGLWYIVGVAVRLAVDSGLHYEDADLEAKKTPTSEPKTEKEGKREWNRDMRRRLWWCVYNLDRLVSTCVGRPFGIADEVISTQFPSMLDDQYIHPTKGLIQPPPGENPPSYKVISHHYTRFRLLQSEILQVLQQQSHAFSFASASSETAFKRDIYKGKQNYPRHHPYHLQTPYLHNHVSLQAWHRDIDRRLNEWMDTAPKSRAETGVEFSPEFLELNYWQAKIMLYRPCLSVPVLLAGELGSSSSNARSRAAAGEGGAHMHVRAEDEERVYLIVAEAGSKVLRIYRQLHRVHQVNYTFLATHHLFMAGISFLYAIWHSPLVRSRLSMDEVDFTILAATSVLGDLVDKCPPAEACRDAFQRMSRATVQMCLGGGRGPTSTVTPSGTYQTTPPHHPIEQNDHGVKDGDAHTQARQYRPVYQPQSSQPLSHISPTQQHQIMQQRRDSRDSSSTDSYSQSHAEARHRQPIQFDEGFRELFTSPRPPHITTPTGYPPPPQHAYVHSPTTPTDGMQYHPSAYAHTQHPQNIYPQPHAEMMIDPALQHRPSHGGYAPATPGEWGHIDSAQVVVPEPEMWEHDSWSEEGSAAGQVDLFDGFFFGGAGSN